MVKTNAFVCVDERWMLDITFPPDVPPFWFDCHVSGGRPLTSPLTAKPMGPDIQANFTLKKIIWGARSKEGYQNNNNDR